MNNVQHKRDSLFKLLMVLCFNGDNTIKIRSAINDLTRRIKQNEYEIRTQIANNKGKKQQQVILENVNLREIMAETRQHGRIRDVDTLIKETKRFKLQRVLKKDNAKKRSKHIRTSMKINSSKFIGDFWRFLTILDKEDGAKPCEIRPQHFADSKIEVPLTGQTVLGHVQYVKTVNESKKINESELRIREQKTSRF